MRPWHPVVPVPHASRPFSAVQAPDWDLFWRCWKLLARARPQISHTPPLRARTSFRARRSSVVTFGRADDNGLALRSPSAGFCGALRASGVRGSGVERGRGLDEVRGVLRWRGPPRFTTPPPRQGTPRTARPDGREAAAPPPSGSDARSIPPGAAPRSAPTHAGPQDEDVGTRPLGNGSVHLPGLDAPSAYRWFRPCGHRRSCRTADTMCCPVARSLRARHGCGGGTRIACRGWRAGRSRTHTERRPSWAHGAASRALAGTVCPG